MEDERGLTIGEIFKILLKRVWWVVGATALCLLLVVLVTQLWYNKNNQYYTVSYDVVFPNDASGKYPDNTEVLSADFISLRTLTDIKDGVYSTEDPDEFKKIDVDKMIRNDDISVTKSDSHRYTLTAKAKYFSNKEQARKFLRTVAYYPVLRVNKIVEDKKYGVYFDIYDNAHTYEEKIEALVKQKTYLESSYADLMNYGTEVEVNSAALHNLFTEVQRSTLDAMIAANYYVLDTENYNAEADARIAAIELQISENDLIINKLIDMRDGKTEESGVSVYSESRIGDEQEPVSSLNAFDLEIAQLVVKNGELQNQINKINKTKSSIAEYTVEGSDKNKAWKDFESKLEGYRTQMEQATSTLKSVSEKVYSGNSRVIFAGNKMERAGGIGTIVSAVLGAVVGFAAAAIIVCIIDVPKYKRKMALAEGAEKESGEKAESSNESAKSEK